MRQGCFYHAMRGDPELQQAVDYGHRGRYGAVSWLVPGMSAAHQQDLALLAHDRLPAATAGRIFSLRADDLVPQRCGFVINRAGVALDVEFRPWSAGIEVLADRKGGAAARILKRFQVCGAHGFCHSLEDSLCFLA